MDQPRSFNREFADRPCANCPVKEHSLCGQGDPPIFDRLNHAKEYRTYRQGDAIISMGAETVFVATVLDGAGYLSQATGDGRRQIVGLLLPGDFLGNPGKSRSAFSVTAATDITLCCVPGEAFRAAMADQPETVSQILAMKLEELDWARDWLELLGRKTAQERLASFLVYMAQRSPTACTCDDFGIIDIVLNRASIARFLGLSAETISRLMTSLETVGILKQITSRLIEIPDFHALCTVTGDDGFVARTMERHGNSHPAVPCRW